MTRRSFGGLLLGVILGSPVEASPAAMSIEEVQSMLAKKCLDPNYVLVLENAIDLGKCPRFDSLHGTYTYWE